MIPRFTIVCAILGAIAAVFLPEVTPGPPFLETLVMFVLSGAALGFVFDLLIAIGYAAMTRDHQHNPDPNVNAHRIVQESTRDDSDTPADLEGAWKKWSESIQRVDERGWTLLWAAFEAGWEAGTKSGRR